MSAVGSHGMGGVGKTTALRALCHELQVREYFPDGICSMEFGQESNDGKVFREVKHCVTKFGGNKMRKRIEEDGTLEGGVDYASEWLSSKAVLLVCDDLWPREHMALGYLPVLKKLLRDAPDSGLLISTRDWNIDQHLVTLSSLDC